MNKPNAVGIADMEMCCSMLREIGNIGTGSAATALSTVLGQTINISLPEVKMVDFNSVMYDLGGPEKIIGAVLAEFSGEMHGLMLFMMDLDFINVMIQSLMGKNISDWSEIQELEVSAMTEVGNIMIASYVNAIAELTNVTMNLSVPSVAINMLGGIMSVPITMYGCTSDTLMTIRGTLSCDGQEVYCGLLMLPDEPSLDYLMHKLGVAPSE